MTDGKYRRKQPELIKRQKEYDCMERFASNNALQRFKMKPYQLAYKEKSGGTR